MGTTVHYMIRHSVGIDLKELGCQMSKCSNFWPVIEI